MSIPETTTHSETSNGSSQRVDELMQSMRRDLDQGILPARAFFDQDLHELELERIFARCWSFVGLESEIPAPGDYMLRYIGEDQFIIARDEDGVIRVLFNKCLHRGAPVCRAEKGNTSHFRCQYHSWLYKNTGEWSGAPFRRRAYKNLDSKDWGLMAAPHVDSVHGLIFAALDADAPTLDEYLGEMRWYLDAIFGLSDQGMISIGEPQRWRVPVNWKSSAENAMADAYHVPSLHRSGEEVGVFPDIEAGGAGGSSFHIYFDQGHGMITNRGFLPPPWDKAGFPPEVSEGLEPSTLTPQQLEYTMNYSATTFLIFPNLEMIRVPATAHPGAAPTVFTYLRMVQPDGPNAIVNWNWTLGWKTASDEFNNEAYISGLAMHGPAGIFDQDDAVVWEGAPRAGKSAFARKNNMKFNYQLGLDGMSDYGVDPEWTLPGIATTSALGEAPQRAFYKRWLREISTP
ncbi:aromatic ring-hydroxylating oxygenase subunit alpha [Rhodococcus erythropolis]|uniref:aromatic ring-hydroxylating oxygenase subunit alpha n=1 Tax=Rhodococcus erythropolis TaxID=1833 RepID=UPI0027E2F4BB|nr:Rieske 2Fe-2S domain-containing protein [Rhodococcus erythropolis]